MNEGTPLTWDTLKRIRRQKRKSGKQTHELYEVNCKKEEKKSGLVDETKSHRIYKSSPNLLTFNNSIEKDGNILKYTSKFICFIYSHILLS